MRSKPNRPYFAYGSNMDPGQMARRCPGALSRGRARLPGHSLTFTWDSKRWRGGVGQVVSSPGDEVWGVLWHLSARHERRLDRYELVRKDVYRKASVKVEHQDGDVEALIYLATATEWKDPSRRYVEALIRGAEAHAFPEDYVQGLRRLLTA